MNPRTPRTLVRTVVVPVAALALALGSEGAFAQEREPLQITADLGFVNAAGNTELTTINMGEELVAAFGPWGLKQTFGVVYGRTDGEVSASFWRGSLRGDRTLGGRVGVYVLGAFDRNTFAGISRRFEEGAGLVLRILDTPVDLLEFEAGGGLTQQRSTTGETDSFTSLRAAGTYRRGFSEASHVQLFTEVLPNLDESEDLRVNAAAELVAPLAGAVAMKFSYVVRFDNLPEPGFEKADRIFTAGLQIAF